MEDEKDAFGHALYEHFLGTEAPIIIERDDGNIDVSADTDMYFREYELWEQSERSAIDQAVGRVLDIGAGAGRHALHLQNHGHDVVALDNSPLAIEVMKLRGIRNTALMPVTQVSSKLGIFDTIIMMGNNFGLAANEKRAKWLFRRFYSLTPPDARVIATSLDPQTTTDPIHLAYHERNRRRGRLPGQVRIRARYRIYIGEWFEYLLVSQPEMEDILTGTGWHVESVIASDSPVYFATIRKDVR